MNVNIFVIIINLVYVGSTSDHVSYNTRSCEIKSNFVNENLNLFCSTLPNSAVMYLYFQNGNFPELKTGVLAKFESATKVYLNNSRLETIQDAAFMGLTALEELYLNDNNISVLKARSFSNLGNLKILDLSKNSLKISEQGLFDSLRSLRLLNLSYNKLEKFSVPLFEYLWNLEILDLSHNNLLEMDSNAFSQLRSLQKIYLNNNNLELFKIYLFKGLTNLQLIDGSFNKLSSLNVPDTPQTRQLNLSNNKFAISLNIGKINIVDFSKNKIFKITVLSPITQFLNISWNELANFDFTNARDLEVLDASHNVIKKIDINSFKSLEKLKIFNLSYNLLEDLESGTFNGLNSLLHLSLQGNRFAVFKQNVFGALKKLQHLDLSSNKIKSIEGNVLSGLLELRVLNLSSNSLFEVSESYFKSLSALETIDLSYNALTSVDPNFIVTLMNVRTVLLQNNNLVEIILKLADTIILDVLDLSNNKITVLNTPDTRYFKIINNGLSNQINFGDNYVDLSRNEISDIFISSNKTEFLNVSWNSLTALRPSYFTNAINLKTLNASHNVLTEIVANTFKTTKNLKILDLSHNALNDIPAGTLDALHKLEVIDISHNNFIYLYEQTSPILIVPNLNNFPHLKKMILNDNPWSCVIFKNSKFLNITKIPVCNNYARDMYHIEEITMPSTPLVKKMNINSEQVESSDIPDQLQSITLMNNTLDKFIDKFANTDRELTVTNPIFSKINDVQNEPGERFFEKVNMYKLIFAVGVIVLLLFNTVLVLSIICIINKKLSKDEIA